MQFLMLHDSEVDLYKNRLRRAISQLPSGLLMLEYECRPVITDFRNPLEDEEAGIELACGFHPGRLGQIFPSTGIVFSLDTLSDPDARKLREVRLNILNTDRPYNRPSTFMIGGERYILTGRLLNLDMHPCDDLVSGERYSRPRQLVPDELLLDISLDENPQKP